MQGKHIIIVEDEEQTRFSLSIILKKDKYKVTTAADGLSAFNKINEARDTATPIDFLLTDIQLPFMTGLELIDKLNKDNLSLPTLVITGYGNKEMIVDLMRKGCEEYIDKPFDPDELLNRVAAVLNKREKMVTENEKKVVKIEQESIKLNQMLDSYKHNFDLLKNQISSAVDAYKNLIQIKHEGYKVATSCRYKHIMELGGDFVDIRNTANGCDIVVADVAGHDMGASYHTVMLKAFFDENCRAGNSGESFFKLLNKQLIENGQNDRMVTANYLSLDLKKMRGEIIVAAHPSIISLANADKSVRVLNVHGDVLGINEDVSFDTRSFDIKSGDRLFLHTDGLVDVFQINNASGKKEKLTVDGLVQLIKKYSDLSIKDMIHSIWNDIMQFCRFKLSDDILILGIEIP
ncbi:MAG: SpoIIE family protein phosphatase [Candidatus Anammoxibacter sp.]